MYFCFQVHRRFQRSSVQGCLRGGRHDRVASRGHRRHPRRLHGRNPRGPGQEKAEPQLLCISWRITTPFFCFGIIYFWFPFD